MKRKTQLDYLLGRVRRREAVKRYAVARKLLIENKDLVMLKYYNNYARSQSLKVYWMIGFDPKLQPERRRRAFMVHKRLSALADYVREGATGGDIYGFTVR